MEIGLTATEVKDFSPLKNLANLYYVEWPDDTYSNDYEEIQEYINNHGGN